MLAYTTIFVASLIAALVIRYIYISISESTRSVSKSRARKHSAAYVPSHKKNMAARRDALNPAFRSSQVTDWNMARAKPATPTHQANWHWKGSNDEVRGHNPGHGTGVFHNNRSNLYGAAPAEPTVNAEWPHRQERVESAGTAYKVTRKLAPKF